MENQNSLISRPNNFAIINSSKTQTNLVQTPRTPLQAKFNKNISNQIDNNSISYSDSKFINVAGGLPSKKQKNQKNPIIQKTKSPIQKSQALPQKNKEEAMLEEFNNIDEFEYNKEKECDNNECNCCDSAKKKMEFKSPPSFDQNDVILTHNKEFIIEKPTLEDFTYINSKDLEVMKDFSMWINENDDLNNQIYKDFDI